MLELKNINVRIGKKQILQDVTFSLRPHTMTAIIGKNGCGKSTLVSCINQMQTYTGEILFNGQSLAVMSGRERAKLISVLPQVLKSPHIRVEELVRMGRNPYVDVGHHLTLADMTAVGRGMESVEMTGFADCYVDELSGGERQKAYLAMILAQDTRVLVLDEPTTYMDMAYEGEFLEQLARLKKENKKTLLVVMHNLNLATEYADNIIVMKEGRVVFQGTREECLEGCIIEETFGVKRYAAEGKIFFR